ncbi:GNAT family N-acetyltransferase [Shewanella mangrovisoli]|uniref:GNAT family N-acetyltransferase n=1 Tax=Shewanella mangrovisoli TaxID=2864211 RepID=UPI001C65D47E|nr:GNAT family N-acetyltransferase [Shewanella mangrovisoli]QYK08494.1 GNAT family N-acetyltransferase [Shewanella mangrovisoli]
MLRIRKATQLDAKACWDIRNAAINKGCAGFYAQEDLEIWTQGELTESFRRMVGAHFYVAEILNETTQESTVVGTIMLDEPYAQVEALFVSPEAMGLGVGRSLLQFIETKAFNLGLAQLRLESTLNAVEFYRHCGFGGEGLEEDAVYCSPRGIALDCRVMYKNLGRLTSRR